MKRSKVTRMKNPAFYILLLLTFMSLTKIAVADDIDDIRIATLAHFEAQNRGDAEARIAHHIPEHTQFADGGLLKESHSLQGQLQATRALYESGIKFDLKLTNMTIKIYNKAAVVTGHVVGTVITPDGEVINAREQRTAVLIKEDENWKEVHVHISPLTAEL